MRIPKRLGKRCTDAATLALHRRAEAYVRRKKQQKCYRRVA
jgi:hypothetical protein